MGVASGFSHIFGVFPGGGAPGGARSAAAMAGPLEGAESRLTAEAIANAPQYMNCVDEYHVDMRGKGIAMLENLGVTENQFDCMDITDNDVARLDGFPVLRKLKTLLASNNRIARIAPNIAQKLPNLETLALANNRIAAVADLAPLEQCAKLECLSLLDNPVAASKNYRLHVVRQLPQLKLLDFRRVKPKEREAARAVGEPGAGTSTAVEEGGDADMAAELGPEDAARAEAEGRRAKLRAAIANATSLEEAARLEDELADTMDEG